MIEFKHVYKTYNKSIDVLKDVNFNINNGEYVCIIGRSGAGKSTIAKLLTAEEKATKGQIIIDGWDITKISKRDIPSLRRQVATIFQDFRLLQKKTARENISFACEICGDFGDKMQKKIDQLLQVVGLSNKGDNYPSELSGGEQQRVAIARALAFNPSILIADEPTGNLDTINTKGILTLLEDINNMGTTIILISHDKEVVNSLNKRIITLEDGVVISDKENGSYII
ncbi:ATP-binding cassette domain-containing protein [Patescibacteria group bacterium]|nr:ATP-binding cassette domain-containing protein [Patescibacteria group bacterium]HQL11596.1 ATP-binding cassette domain-containing protein [bacterium]